MATAPVIPGLGLRTEAPKISKKADFSKVALTPQEGFVLSRVDGQTTLADICLISGLGEEATVAILLKLKNAGVIITSAPLEAQDSGRGRASQAGRPHPGQKIPTPLPVPLLNESDIDPELLADGKDLPIETKRRILSVHRRLHGMDCFQLLGVSRDADRQEIRRAYFRLSKEFHPDRYFGLEVGAYREWLGEVFKAVSTAFEKLSKDDERAAYLAQLEERESGAAKPPASGAGTPPRPGPPRRGSTG
jgi:hypothetical protein